MGPADVVYNRSGTPRENFNINIFKTPRCGVSTCCVCLFIAACGALLPWFSRCGCPSGFAGGELESVDCATYLCLLMPVRTCSGRSLCSVGFWCVVFRAERPRLLGCGCFFRPDFFIFEGHDGSLRDIFCGEFDSGSGRALAACLTHASRAGSLVLAPG